MLWVQDLEACAFQSLAVHEIRLRPAFSIPCSRANDKARENGSVRTPFFPEIEASVRLQQGEDGFVSPVLGFSEQRAAAHRTVRGAQRAVARRARVRPARHADVEPASAAAVNLTVGNSGASLLGTNAANISGTLAVGVYGDDCASIRLLYGQQEGGTTRAAWDQNQFLAVNTNFNLATFTATLTNLARNTNYFLRFSATNSSGEAWATGFRNSTPAGETFPGSEGAVRNMSSPSACRRPAGRSPV